MSTFDDLSPQALAPALGDRPLQTHALLLSTAVAAGEWARAGAPHGAVVVADNQVSPRGRSGRPWRTTPGRGLGFAVVLRPELAPEREGFLYTVLLAALAEVCGPGVAIEWPDELRREDGEPAAAAGLDVRLGPGSIRWAVANVLVHDTVPPRGGLLAAALAAVDARLRAPAAEVQEEHRRLCATLGRSVRVQLLGGVMRIEGTAVQIADDGSLVLETGDERLVPVRPQDVRSIGDSARPANGGPGG